MCMTYNKQYSKKYANSLKGQEALKRAAIRYKQTEKGRATIQRTNLSIGAKQSRKKYYKKRGKIWQQCYMRTPNGKLINNRKNAKRRTKMFIPLMNNPFPKHIAIDWHHIDDIFVIPVPRRFHQLGSTNNVKKHRERIIAKMKTTNLLNGLEDFL